MHTSMPDLVRHGLCLESDLFSKGGSPPSQKGISPDQYFASRIEKAIGGNFVSAPGVLNRGPNDCFSGQHVQGFAGEDWRKGRLHCGDNSVNGSLHGDLQWSVDPTKAHAIEERPSVKKDS